MAATLTGAGELTYASFPIDKVETDADGDLIVYGKASDGSIDSDQQIVDPSWMAAAAQAWKESGANLRVQHNPQRDPAGVGLEVETDSSGATWVKGLVVEPIAKKLVAKGALRAYSVGIARPTITRDATARGGRITDGELVEISLVDRPANKRCGIQLVKSADDGTPEYVNEVFGAEADIAKALGADVTKGADDDFVNVDLPPGASISISPADFARLRTFKQQLVTKAAGAGDEDAALKAISAAENPVYKRDIDTATRRRLAGDGKALPNLSYPIENAGDLENAAHLARTGHGDVGAARKLIARRARELGVANPLDDDDSTSKGTVTDTAAKADAPEATSAEIPEAVKEAEPEVTKDPEDEDKPKPVKKAKKKPKGPKKMPPWLNKPDDAKDGDDGDSDDSCKTAHAWTLTGSGDVPDIVCEKCHTTPAEAAGLSGTHDMTCAPVPELLESPPMASTKGGPTPRSASGADEAPSMTPVPQHREPDGAIVEPFEKDAKFPAEGQGETPTPLEAGMMKSPPEVAAILRFKAAGIDIELGRLHDLTCPAYHPEDTAKCHPFADLRYTDEGYFQRKAVEAACGPDMDRAKSINAAWQAARVLREADPAQLNDFRMDAHKAFRDANPGPTSAPTPGMMTPGRYNRPLITDGHEASSPAHDGPNSSPAVATSAPSAHSFDRPPLASGHQSPSPSHMKADFEYPSQAGVPTQLNYAVMEKEKARQALAQMHEHLSRQFPEACPMRQDATQPESRPVPPTAGIGKGAAPDPVPAPPVAASFKADPEDGDLFADAEVYKGFKKQRKKLGKKVLSGSMTVDEARAKLGRQFAQKGSSDEGTVAATYVTAEPGMTPTAIKGLQDSLNRLAGDPAYDQKVIVLPPAQKSAPPALHPSPAPAAPVAAPFGPDDIEAAVTKAVAPLLEKIREQDDTYTTKLAEQQRVIDAIADQPDPSTAAFSGLAFNPLHTKAARPAGVASQAEIAERTQHMVMRTLQDKYNSSSDPTEREAYYSTLAKMRGYSEP